jgi:hypothetical protein
MALEQRTATVSLDSWFVLYSGTNYGGGQNGILAVGRYYQSSVDWRSRFAIAIPRGSLFDGIPNADAITAFRIKLRATSGCDGLGANVRFFLERGTTAFTENSEGNTGTKLCTVHPSLGTASSRYPGPTRTATDRAFYSGSPTNGQWITVNALALGKWWFANPTVTELVLVAVAANDAGSAYDENTYSRRFTAQSRHTASAPFAELEFDANTPPNIPTDLAPAEGSKIASTPGTSATVTSRYTDPDGNLSTKYQAQWFPSTATDETPGAATKDQTITVNTANNGLRSHTFTGLPTRTAGKWRMRFYDGQAWGPFSLLRAATTAYQPGVPAQLYITPNTLSPSHFANLVSQDGSDHISAAQVIVEQVPSTGSIITKWDSGKQVIGGSPTRAELAYGGSALQWGQVYRWRIRLWNRDDIVSDYTANVNFTPLEQIGPAISPGDTSSKQNVRNVTFTLSRPGGGNIDQARLRAYNDAGTTVLYDSGIVSFTAAASRNITVPAGTWDWGQEPWVDGAIRNSGDANMGPFSDKRQVRINAAPGAPYPLTVTTTGAIIRADDVVVVPSEQPTFHIPFIDLDKQLGYTEAPKRREIEVRSLANAHVGASPYIITSTITETWQVPAAVMSAGTTYKVRARYDDNADVRSSWSDYLFVKASAAPTVGSVAPSGTVTDPRPTIEWASTAQEQYRVTADVDGARLYDSGWLTGTDEELRLPAFTVPNEATVDVTVEVANEDGLTASATGSFDTDFATPDALTGLVVTPDPDNLAVALAWDASTDDNFYAYRVEARDRFGQWQLVTDITDIDQAALLYTAIDHNRSTVIRVRQSNGFAYSEAAEESGELEIRGYHVLDPTTSAHRELRYVQDQGYAETPEVEQHEYRPVGSYGAVIIAGQYSGMGHRVKLWRPPEDDTLDWLRSQQLRHAVVLLKTPSRGTHRVQWRDVPSADRVIGYHDIDLVATTVRET